MIGLIICNKEQYFSNILVKHFDDLVERKAMEKIDKQIYKIDFLGSILAYEQRKPTEFEIRETINHYKLHIDEKNISKGCIVLTGNLKLLSTAYIHYEGLIREGLMKKNNQNIYEITEEGIAEMIKMFQMLGK